MERDGDGRRLGCEMLQVGGEELFVGECWWGWGLCLLWLACSSGCAICAAEVKVLGQKSGKKYGFVGPSKCSRPANCMLLWLCKSA